MAKDCDVSIKCFNCRGRHHIALCKRNLNRFGQNSPGSKEKTLETQSSTQSEPAKEEQNTKPVAFCGISTDAENSRKSSILQTAVDAREILNLSTISKENVIIKVFGSDDDEIKSYDLVALKLMSLTDDFEINVKCLEVPFICSPLTQGQEIDWARENYSHLEDFSG